MRGLHSALRWTAILVAAGSLWATAPAIADVVNYHADMTTSANVPPITNSKGTGTVDATYDAVTKQLTYTVTYSGLSGPATAAHFHGPADPTANAGPTVTITGGLASPIKGMATLSDAEAADLQGGKWYFNVHTALNPNGEIRGTVLKK